MNEYHRDVSDEELLSDMKWVASELKTDSLTAREYQEHGHYSPSTIRRRFGSWIAAMNLCNMKPNTFQTSAALAGHEHQFVNTDDLLADIKRVALLLEKEAISSLEYGEHGIYSRSLCHKRFATWNEALKHAGLKPSERILNQRLDDEDMLKEIERMWIKLGRQPTASDMKAGISHYSLHAYAEHFGGWRGALQAFVKYINEEDPIAEYNSEGEPVTEVAVVKKRAIRNNNDNVISSPIDTPCHKTPRDVNYRLRFKVMQRDNFKCCLCGKSPAKDPSIELHVDHIYPWARGGETVMDNLQTLCSVCNLGKSDLVP